MCALVIERINKAGSLPGEWDQLAHCYFQRKEFLHHVDLFNPCFQRYYLIWDNQKLLAGACVYTLPIHLFSFSRIPSKISMQVMGIPTSVSAPGLISKTKADAEILIHYILKHEKGLLLGLNLPPDLRLHPAIEMNMMPTVKMEPHFDSWEEYLSSLRSPYRRRAHQVSKAFKGVKEVKTNCLAFSEKHYDLYLQIMRRTKDKLETLSLSFFNNLPASFHLTSYYHQDQLLCWHITCINDGKLFFFFGGHDYRLLRSFHSYFNNLFGILKEAIIGGYEYIDFGQTAELAKMKTGGQQDEKKLFLYHHNPLWRSLLRICKPLITYHSPKEIVHPIKRVKQNHPDKNKRNENIISKAATIS